jgi:hypothetical protein
MRTTPEASLANSDWNVGGGGAELTTDDRVATADVCIAGDAAGVEVEGVIDGVGDACACLWSKPKQPVVVTATVVRRAATTSLRTSTPEPRLGNMLAPRPTVNGQRKRAEADHFVCLGAPGDDVAPDLSGPAMRAQSLPRCWLPAQ